MCTILVFFLPNTFSRWKHTPLWTHDPDAYIKLVQSRGQLPDARVPFGFVGGRGSLSSVGDAGDGLLDLFEHVISVGSGGSHVRVAEKSLGGRVQHCGVLLQSSSGSGHLISTVRVLQLLCVRNTDVRLAARVSATELRVTGFWEHINFICIQLILYFVCL